MAECHPVAFRWPMKAKAKHGAKLIHVDPRFTRTSAMCDIYAPIRAGTDIAFLGGLINYVIKDERWNTDPFFQEYVLNYTNAADDRRRRLQGHRGAGRGLLRPDGVHSGIKPDWPYDGFVGPVPDRLLAVRRQGDEWASRGAARRTPRRAGTRPQCKPRPASRSTSSSAAAQAATRRDETLQHPRLRLPAREAPLQPLHPGDGGAGDRLPAGRLHSRSPRRSWRTRAATGPPRSPTRWPGPSTPTAPR